MTATNWSGWRPSTTTREPPETKGPRTMIDFDIKNRYADKVMFTAPIAADEATPLGVKIGLAVK